MLNEHGNIKLPKNWYWAGPNEFWCRIEYSPPIILSGQNKPIFRGPVVGISAMYPDKLDAQEAALSAAKTELTRLNGELIFGTMPDENGWILMSEREPKLEDFSNSISIEITQFNWLQPEIWFDFWPFFGAHKLRPFDAWRPFIPPQPPHEKCKGCGREGVLKRFTNLEYFVRCGCRISGTVCWSGASAKTKYGAWAAWNKVME